MLSRPGGIGLTEQIYRSRRRKLYAILAIVFGLCVLSALLPSQYKHHETKNAAPAEIRHRLLAVAAATRAYSLENGIAPVSLDDIRGMPPLNSREVNLADIIYTPEFLGSPRTLLAYAPVAESDKIAVLYFFTDRVVLLSKEELEAELARMRIRQEERHTSD